MSTFELKKKVGTIRQEELGELSIYEGITDKLIDQVVHYANTDDALQTTSDPRRFKDRAAFEQWLLKGRDMYVLIDDTEELLGLIWFGPKELPEATYLKQFDQEKYGLTFSIRTYGRARGKHLAREFTALAFQAYEQSDAFTSLTNNKYWLETPANNLPAVNAYTKYGFIQVSTPDEKGRIIMILE